MFTGLIETVGALEALTRRGGAGRLRVRARFAERLAIGESLAVDGVCLTVAQRLTEGFQADLSTETIARTTIGSWKRGRRLNLEKALKASGRFGGHMVQGHVDAAGRLLRLHRDSGQTILRVSAPPDLRGLIALKGSIAIDGVSLTVSNLGRDWFEVALIPYTLAATNLSDRKPGDAVNLEADMVARYLARLLEAGGGTPPRRR